MLYFAYGSNLAAERLRERVGAFAVLGPARADGRRLECNKLGRDGSGKANLVEAPGEVAWGVVYGLGVRGFDLGRLGFPDCGQLWGHTGFLKSFVFYWPDRDVTFCGTLNQSAAQGAFSSVRPVSALVPALVEVLARG